MADFKTNSFSSQIQLLLDSQVEIPQKLKQHLVFKSDQVSNPFKFIGGLLCKGVLCDGTDDSEANFGLKEMMVRLAMMISCAKGAKGVGGLMEALEESGNSILISDLKAWMKQDFGTEIEINFREPKGDGSAAQTQKSQFLAAQTGKYKERCSCGTILVDKIMTHLEDDLMGQLEGHLVSEAAEIVNIPEFCSSLAIQQVPDENELQLGTEPEVKHGQKVKKITEAACLKRAIAFQNSSKKRILTDTDDWLQTSQARKKNHPISLKSLARQSRRTTATGLFAATRTGLIALDLGTIKATALTSAVTLAAAVNNKLNKVYWTEGWNSRIMRFNFDGSAKEIIVPQTGDSVFMLAIHEPSGNVYFAQFGSNEITICNALGQNRAAVISDSELVKCPVAFALDSDKGFMYWGNRETSPHSLVRAKLDGSKATIISTDFIDIYGIALDKRSKGVLYWADSGTNTIGTIEVNSGNKRTLVELEDCPGPWGIQVYAHKIYFGEFNNLKIQSVEKCSGKELTTLFKSPGNVRQLALFNVPT